eukprot:240715_1
MAARTKLQTEIDRTLKKIDEGIEDFDLIWKKVHEAPNQNLKEKHEADLKKEIKKLQRYREQVKAWASNNDIKNKQPLLDARHRIETEMERFKICEKETKTKAYSKEALQQIDKQDELTGPKAEIKEWTDGMLDTIRSELEDLEAKLDHFGGNRKKKRFDKEGYESIQETIEHHQWHIENLEKMFKRLLKDQITHHQVDEIKDSVEYYVESNQEPDFFYDEYVYEPVEVDADPEDFKEESDEDKNYEPTPPPSPKTKRKKSSKDTEAIAKKTSGTKTKKTKKSVTKVTSNAPLKIDKTKATALQRTAAAPRTAVQPKANPAPIVVKPGGASMASIIKQRAASEQKAKKQSATVAAVKQPTAASVAKAVSAAVVKKQAAVSLQPQVVASLKPSPQKKPQPKSVPSTPQQTKQQPTASISTASMPAKQPAASMPAAAKPSSQPSTPMTLQPAAEPQLQRSPFRTEVDQFGRSGPNTPLLQPNGLSAAAALSVSAVSASMPAATASSAAEPIAGPVASAASVTASVLGSQSLFDSSFFGSVQSSAVGSASGQVAPPENNPEFNLKMLDVSLRNRPGLQDSERQKTYVPRNPFRTPDCFTYVPAPTTEDPKMFSKFDTDTLFFIFYFQQGTYQQYLAARELKRQCWRYHKKYLTWFQRHDDPKVTTENFEQGTYVYFDYDSSWCQRIKTEFVFEYGYLEDELK